MYSANNQPDTIFAIADSGKGTLYPGYYAPENRAKRINQLITPENNWDTLYNQHIPRWMIPQGENVALYFFEGLPPGEQIPWGAWVTPLSYWYGFFLALKCLSGVVAQVVRRRDQ